MNTLLRTLLLVLALAPGLAAADIYLDNRNACRAISGVWMNTPMLRNRVAECRLHESFTLPRDERLEIASGYDLYVDSDATLTNRGQIYIYPMAQLLVERGYFSNQGSLRNDGGIAVQSGSILNDGNVDNDGSISILRRPNSSLSNLFFNSGTINLEDDGHISNESVVLNHPGGRIVALAGSVFSNDGDYYPRDDRIAGDFRNHSRGRILVNQTLSFENGAKLSNEGLVQINRSPARLNLENGSRLDNHPGGEIHVLGGWLVAYGSTLDNDGNLVNDSGGLVSIENVSLLRNTPGGRIDNQTGMLQRGIVLSCDSKFENYGVVTGKGVDQKLCGPPSLVPILAWP